MLNPYRFKTMRHRHADRGHRTGQHEAPAGSRRRRNHVRLRSAPLRSKLRGTWLFMLLLIGLTAFQDFMQPPSGFCEEIVNSSQNLATDSPLINEARETASLVTSILKVLGALILVLGLMLLLVQVMRRLGMGNRQLPHGPLIKVLDSRMIAPKKHVAVIDVAGEFIAVGITDQQVNLLTTLAGNDLLSEAAEKIGGEGSLAQYAPSFSAMLNKAKHGLKRKN